MYEKLLLFLPLMILLVPFIQALTLGEIYDKTILLNHFQTDAITDSSPVGHNGAITGSPTLATTGCVSGNCHYFDGVDDFVEYSNIDQYTTQGNYSGACWTNFSSPADYAQFMRYYTGNDDGKGNMYLRYSGPTPDTYIQYNREASAYIVGGYNFGAIDTPAKKLSGFVINHTGDTVTVFIVTNYTGHYVGTGASTMPTNAAGVWRLGGYTAGVNLLRGMMDECFIANTTLTFGNIDSDFGRLWTLGNEGGQLEALDPTPPVFVDAGCKSCNPYQNYLNIPWITDDLTPTINFTTDEASTCAVMGNETGNNDYAYTDMIANGGVECTTTGALQHICTVQSSNAFTLGNAKNISVGCKDALGNEAGNAIYSAPMGIYTFGTQCVSDCIKVTTGCSTYLEGGCTTIR